MAVETQSEYLLQCQRTATKDSWTLRKTFIDVNLANPEKMRAEMDKITTKSGVLAGYCYKKWCVVQIKDDKATNSWTIYPEIK
jgi:SH3-like domain-containing protein